jgi:hypothetical protein
MSVNIITPTDVIIKKIFNESLEVEIELCMYTYLVFGCLSRGIRNLCVNSRAILVEMETSKQSEARGWNYSCFFSELYS